MKTISVVYDTDEEFLQGLREAANTQSNVELCYKDINFCFHPYGVNSIKIYIGEEELYFDDFDDFYNNFKIDGKPFKEILPDVDFGTGIL